MVTLRLGPEDVANLRFAISPLMELHNSVRALEHPEAKALHLPWVAATRERVRDLDMALLHALHPRNAYTPDFIDPPPRSPLGELEDELEEMLATPPERVRFELRRAYEGRRLPPILEGLEDELPALADLFRAYWERALARYWPRVRALLEGDVLYRARQLADGGAKRLFADIHPEVSFADGDAADRHALRGHRRPRRPRRSCSCRARSRGRGRRRRSSRRGSRSSSTPPAASAALWEPGPRGAARGARGIARRAPGDGAGCAATPRAPRPSSRGRSTSPPGACPSTCPCCATPGSCTGIAWAGPCSMRGRRRARA